MPKIVGIDLGTSTSAVAVVERGQPRLLVVDDRERLLPSVVTFEPSGEIVVGARAKAQRATNPDFTFTALKRLLGRDLKDLAVADVMEHAAYAVVAGPEARAFVQGPDRAYAPEELLAHVLARLKATAQTVLGQQVGHAVIGVPANFGLAQKEAVRRAARTAGLEPIGLLSEPTAAAIAYGLERGPGKTIAVYDLGGGTFDVSILKVAGQKFRVLATAGDPFLGGEDFDARIIDWLAERFRAKHQVDLRAENLSLQRLYALAETAKVELSAAADYRIVERFVAKDAAGARIDLDELLTRDIYEELVADLVDRTRQPCLDALAAAKLQPRDIDDVVLVGGMTKTPVVQALVEEVFGRVARRTINPIEAVVQGCAIQAAARAGELKSLALQDVTNASFGLEAANGAFVPILRRGSPIPTAKTVRTGPADDDAGAVALRVFEGDLKAASDNRRVATVVLDDLPPAPRGRLDLDVTFDLDQDGVLSVALTEVATGRRVLTRVHADTGLAGAAIETLRGLSDEGPEVMPEAEAAEAAQAEPAADLRAAVGPESEPSGAEREPTADADIDDLLAWAEPPGEEPSPVEAEAIKESVT